MWVKEENKEVAGILEICAEKNQKLIITILDEFIEEMPEYKICSARGSLAMDTNPDLQSRENFVLS
ncbi:MAG: hypothetical protein IJA10_06005 [Lachnospiraceae bacterium]|nr:hypothetical protein [Lachnospiraceae bacterium]